jgi:hypothetical protein
MAINTKPGQFALLMENGIPIGVTPDAFGKEALHVKVGNKPNEPIPVYVTQSVPGVEKMLYGEGVTTPGGGTISLISQTVPAGLTWVLGSAPCSCGFEAVFSIKINSVIKAKVRTGPGQPTAPFSFNPFQPIQEGDSIEIEVTTAAHVPQTDASTTLMLVET